MPDPTTAVTHESLDQIQARHRKEVRDLVSRTTQKKKQASKKTRRSVNEECEQLERELRERHEREVARLNGGEQEGGTVEEEDEAEDETRDEDQDRQSLDQTRDEEQPKPETTAHATTTAATTTSAPKKPNRAKARLARRAAAQTELIAAAEREAAEAPDQRALEREGMATQLLSRKLQLHEVRADGHCLYAAVADQLRVQGASLTPPVQNSSEVNSANDAEAYKKVRGAAADWIAGHEDDFAGFLEEALDEHVRKVRETGEWGGHVELLALARAYRVRICVLHGDGRVDAIAGVEEEEKEKEKEVKEIWLGYYRHSHGLGEHYNSLRKMP